MALLHRKRVLGAKIESVPGTPESLTATNGSFDVFDVTVEPDVPMTELLAQNSLSRLPSVPGARSGKVNFSLYVTGGATAPSWATTFLPSCGFVQATNTFSLTSVSANYKTLTMGVYVDGVFYSLAGAMGTVGFEGENGKPLKANFSYTGVWQPVSDAANISPTYPGVVAPRLASASLSLGTYSPSVAKLTLDLNNEIHLLESINTISGYSYAVVVNRNVTGTLDAEAVRVGTSDVWGQWLSGTEQAMSFSLGTTGNQVSFAMPKSQYTALKEGNRGDISTTDTTYQANRSAADDDELTITFA